MSSNERIYRDPVHNIIRLDTSCAEGRLLVEIIDTPEFQRLRRIKQLGLANYAYQGAEHSRFSHSLGVMHLAGRILDSLERKYTISETDRLAIRVSALLHDVGHGAFSHVIEPILDFRHEDFTVEVVLDKSNALGATLAEYSSELPKKIARIINGEFRPSSLGQIVSSQLDADRMDYLIRDSLMTGVKYGNFDLEWVIKSLEIDEENDRIYVSAPGIYAVEEYLQARYYMFRQVYFHRTLRAGESLLRSLFRRALLRYPNDDVWLANGSPFESLISGSKLSLEQHLKIDDSDLTFHIKQWQYSEDRILSDLAKRFTNRRIFKAIDLEGDAQEESIDKARNLVGDGGFDPEYYFAVDSAGDVPYNYYAPDSNNRGKLIYVETGISEPKIQEISQVSTAVRGLQKSFRIRRICFPHELYKHMKQLVKF